MAVKEKTMNLSEPVSFGSEQITSVTITRKLKYLRGYSLKVGADGSGGVTINFDFETLMDLGSKMIGHPISVIEEFAEDDQSAIMQEAQDFLLKHLGTGKAQ